MSTHRQILLDGLHLRFDFVRDFSIDNHIEDVPQRISDHPAFRHTKRHHIFASDSWTMLLLAIILAVPLERFGAELPWDMPLMAQSAVCGAAITVVEFVAGLIINVWLGMGVWDYSAMPGNIMGQVCPQFLVMWVVLAAVGIVMLDWMRYGVEGGVKPHYFIMKGN